MDLLANYYDSFARSYLRARCYEIARQYAFRYWQITGRQHELWEDIVSALVLTDEQQE